MLPNNNLFYLKNAFQSVYLKTIIYQNLNLVCAYFECKCALMFYAAK